MIGIRMTFHMQETSFGGFSAPDFLENDSPIAFGGHIALVSAGFFSSLLGGGTAIQLGRALCKNISVRTGECVALGALSATSFLFAGMNTIIANSLGIENMYVTAVAGGCILGVGGGYALKHRIFPQRSLKKENLQV
jgi:hypothetical protein